MRKFLVALALTGLFGCGIENNIIPPDEPNAFFGNPQDYVSQWEEESFLEHSRKPTDILFVIDPSCSMDDNILQISNNISGFFDVLDQYRVDYHIGFVSTHADESDPGSGYLNEWFGIQYIDLNTPSRHSIFSLLSNTDGYYERGIDATWAAISPQWGYHNNSEFFRQDAPLHIIVISDEADQSLHVTPERLVDRLKQVAVKKNASVTFSTISHAPETFSKCAGPSESIGYGYIQVAKEMDGMHINICEDDWSLALEELAEHASPPPNHEYFLGRLPVTDSIQILLERNGALIDYSTHIFMNEDDEEEGDFVYIRSRNSVAMTDYRYQTGDIMHVKYEVLPYSD